MQSIPFPTGLNTAPKLKVKITERALFARLSRSLAKEDKALKKCRQGSRSHSTLGDYYVIDIPLHVVTHSWVNIEEWARESGLMAEWEELENGQGA